MSTKQELPSRFEFQTQESKIIELWNEGNFCHAVVDHEKTPFSMVIPPPNVTGALHLGHALNNSLQDSIIRFRRMMGFQTMWMPGTDHAGIATQAVVERRIREEEGKSRHDLGRENLVKRIWDWKQQYEKKILGQLRSMGCSCDWERLRFTLDEGCQQAVMSTFYDLFKKTWIYRGLKLVNWDTDLRTTVSDDEVFSKTIKGHFWHLRYPVIDPKPGEPEYIIVATTRPETMLGDTAVAVHPEPATALAKVKKELEEKLSTCSEKEKPAIEEQIEAMETRIQDRLDDLNQLADMAADGRKLMLPLMNREIPLVADRWAKPELGSGCVKITPAHDPNDYEVGKRCQLPMINIMNPNGHLNVEAGTYAGLSMKEARKKVVADMEEAGLLAEVENRDIEQPHSDRSKTPIEPFLTDQWFVKMDQLAQTAIDVVEEGQIQILPERYTKTYLDWLGEKRDWPVSRQLWWGHQIPVWSLPVASEEELNRKKAEAESLLSEAITSDNASIQVEPSSEPDEEKRLSKGLAFATIHICFKDVVHKSIQDLEENGYQREEDVLDTWFSSALWPHSTLGWPEQTESLEYFYPTNLLITSRDIISLWVARMVLTGMNNRNDIPFDEVFIHPKILDGFGETMSKSKGNGIDPLEIIEKFGTDALRFAMIHLTTDTQDVRLSVDFECPGCGDKFKQTKKNRVLAVVPCPTCKKSFRTQWATKKEELALEKHWVISDRFEVGRNFVNKLWNAARFVFMNLEDYQPGPIDLSDLPTEDRWLLSRMATTANEATAAFENYKFSDAARSLYQYAWNDFCSFYLEICKDRLQDPAQKIQTQRLLAASLDTLLRLLHPIMPFVTEEIWQQLALHTGNRGLDACFGSVDFSSAARAKDMKRSDGTALDQVPTNEASSSVMVSAWPLLPSAWIDTEIEQRFAMFQEVLGAIREVRARQQIDQKAEVKFFVRCQQQVTDLLQPMAAYFKSMAGAELSAIGPEISAPIPNSAVSLAELELFVDMEGHIDIEVELQRLEKEKQSKEKDISSKENRLANENFVKRAPKELVDDVKATLEQAKTQLTAINEAIETLKSK